MLCQREIEKLTRVLVTAMLVAIALTGCDRKDLVLWAPNGKHVAIIASDGLRVGDEMGTLSAPVMKNAEFCRWLPDSAHAVVGSSETTTKWKVVKDLLSANERKTIQRIAERIWTSGSLPKTESTADEKRQAEALLYLMYAHGANTVNMRLHYVLSKQFGISPVCISINTVQIVDLSSKLAPKTDVLWRSTETITDMRISPKGTLAAVCVDASPEFKIFLLPLKSGQPLRPVGVSADCPDWSPDGKSIFYITYLPIDDKTKFEDMHDTNQRPFLAAINCREVADAEGNILPKLGASKKVVQVFAEDASRVRCMPDGSVIFHAKQRTYPSIVTAEKPHACLYQLSPDFLTLKALDGSSQLPGDAMQFFEPNQDGSKIAVPGDHGEIAVLDVASGKETIIEQTSKHDLKFAPQWRTNDELCYPARNTAKLPNGHDVEVVLQSVSQPDQRTVLSKDWPTAAVRFLKDPQESKEKSNAPADHKSASAKKTGSSASHSTVHGRKQQPNKRAR